MFECQSMYLSIGRYIVRLLVFITQPRTVLILEGLASAENFFREIISFLGMLSFGSRGRAAV